MALSGVLGHEKVRHILTSAYLENRVGHAYIFEGPEGIGRKTLAKKFAQLILCENPGKGEPCGVCKSCAMCDSGNHPDLQIITNQLYDESKKSKDVLVDTIRNMKKDIFIKPYLSDRKIYIIPRADTMNVYAQNSLLKVLEEPPEYCTIILIAENSNMFLPTILSRTVPFKFFPLSTEVVEDYLRKEYPKIDENIVTIAAISNGCIGKAKELAEMDRICELREELFSRIGDLSGKGNKSIYDLMLFLKHNKDNDRLIFDMMRSLFRDLMCIKNADDSVKLNNYDREDVLWQMSEKLFSNTPVKMLEILLKYEDYLAKNISYAQIAQCMSLELWEAIHDRSYRN